MKKIIIRMSNRQYDDLRRHLFWGTREQGAFLFAKRSNENGQVALCVFEVYLIPNSSWDFQEEYYLELSEDEKVKVMLRARELDADLIECHSHRGADGYAAFSPSDQRGLLEFIQYIKWKLPGKMYAATVWAEDQIRGAAWLNPPEGLCDIGEIEIQGKTVSIKKHPRGSRLVQRLKQFFGHLHGKG